MHSIDRVLTNRFNRRDFLKKSGQAALAISGGLTLEALVNSCATASIFESQEDIAYIQWDANPAIPVPKNGCYAGWHRDIPTDLKYISPVAYPSMFPRLNKSAMDDEKALIRSYRADYGKGPAAHSFSDRQITDVWFPKGICEVAHNNGVIPLIRYYFFEQFERVAKGDYDKYLKAFAQGAKEFGKPFFLVPYPEVNIGGAYKNVHPWAGGSGKQFKKAYSNIHHILKEEGANNAVFGLHLIGMGAGQPFSRFAVDSDFIDWVGFSIYNLENESGQYRTFSNLIQEAYYFAKSKYPTKPIALWELGTSDTYRQGRWIKDAYNDIKKLPRIKLAVYAEYPTFGGGQDSSTISDKAKPYYKEAISDSHFIGGKK